MKGTRKFEGVIWEKGAVTGKRFLPFYFRVRAFSISRTRLSRSLEQGTAWEASPYFFGQGNNHPVICQGSGLWSLRPLNQCNVYNFLYQNKTQPAACYLCV